MTPHQTAARRWLPWVVSAALSAGILAYLLSQIDPAEIFRTAARLPPSRLGTYGVLVLGGVLSRALRFWVLLGRSVGLGLLVGIVLARNLFVDLLPARVGELSYVYLLARRTNRPLEDGLATLLLAILFDLVALAPLLALGLLLVGRGEALPTTLLVTASVALALVAYAAILAAGPVCRLLVRGLASRQSSPFRIKLTERLHMLATALAETRARGVFVPVLGLSVVVRLCKFGSYYFLVLAVMEALGAAANLEFFRVFLGTVAAELAAALPIHGIAGFGTFEAAWTVAFTQLGFAFDDAVITGIVAHAFSQLVEYSLGAGALLWLMRPVPKH